MGSTAQSFAPAWTGERTAFDEEAALVRRAQAGDQMAFCEIVDLYQRKVFSFIHRVLGQNDEAEDIAQEVFARAFFSIGSYRHEGMLLSWLYRITINQCNEYLRKKKNRPLVYEADLPELRSPAAPADTEAANRELALELLARLSPQHRMLLVMKEVEGYSIEELARMTGLNTNTLKVLLFRARQKLLRAASHGGRKAGGG